MDQVKAMQIFTRVAEMSSFTGAAETLTLPKASVSTAVRQLEQQLGTRLFHRTTRHVELTQDGAVYFDHCVDLLAELDELNTLFINDERALTGRLRVDMPSRLARHQVAPRLPEFLRAHPQLAVELSSTDRRVDLVQEGFDCVLRIGTLRDSSLVARRLGTMRLVNCASPAYLKRHGVPTTINDLRDGHLLVHYASTLGDKPEAWEYFDGRIYRTLELPGVITVNNSDAYEACCLAGLGMIQVPAIGVQHLLDDGQLVEVLPDHPAQSMPVSLLFSHRRNRSRRVQVFADWLDDILRPYLE
ncbi:LysR family transcriptional regulator [uncultured Abyssibacter sp.]|uniref:LysR family transcriptional regulator n=1 Tax=uncultured Abyssibacter sp. TaxID=2320202 RepID=UPI0032B1D56F